MRVTICNFKGGVGKSLLTHQLITSYGYGGVEIDPYGSLHDRLSGDVIKIGLQDALPSFDGVEDDIIFDFGGFADKKLEVAIELSDCVVIPTISTLESLQATVDTINFIKHQKRPILVVVNMMRKRQNLDESIRAINDTLGYRPEVLELPFSDAFQTAINENTSVIKLSKQKGLLGYSYKPAAKLIENLQAKIVECANSRN